MQLRMLAMANERNPSDTARIWFEYGVGGGWKLAEPGSLAIETVGAISVARENRGTASFVLMELRNTNIYLLRA